MAIAIPNDLSEPAKKLWRRLAKGWRIDDAGAAILHTALRSWDQLRSAEKMLEEEGTVLGSSSGMRRVHPAVGVSKIARDGFYRGMRLLNLDTRGDGDADET